MDLGHKCKYFVPLTAIYLKNTRLVWEHWVVGVWAEKGVDLRKILAANSDIHFALGRKGVLGCVFQGSIFQVQKTDKSLNQKSRVPVIRTAVRWHPTEQTSCCQMQEINRQITWNSWVIHTREQYLNHLWSPLSTLAMARHLQLPDIASGSGFSAGWAIILWKEAGSLWNHTSHGNSELGANLPPQLPKPSVSTCRHHSAGALVDSSCHRTLFFLCIHPTKANYYHDYKWNYYKHVGSYITV